MGHGALVGVGRRRVGHSFAHGDGPRQAIQRRPSNIRIFAWAGNVLGDLVVGWSYRFGSLHSGHVTATGFSGEAPGDQTLAAARFAQFLFGLNVQVGNCKTKRVYGLFDNTHGTAEYGERLSISAAAFS